MQSKIPKNPKFHTKVEDSTLATITDPKFHGCRSLETYPLGWSQKVIEIQGLGLI